MRGRFLCLMAAAALLAAPFSQAAHAEEKFELSFQTMYNPAQTQMQEAFVPFAQEVAKRTDGSLKINIFGVGTLVPNNEEADAVKAGNVDIAMSSLIHPKETPYTYLLGMIPDLCRSIEDTVHVGPVLYTLPEIQKEFDKYGIPIGYTSYVPQAFASVSGPIRTPADLRGKRMLVTAPNQTLLAEAWGAVPVMVTMGDIYIGLQRGMGEVYMAGPSWIKGSKLYEIAKDVTIIGFPNTYLIPFLINKDLYEELSDNQRTILLETSKEYFEQKILDCWNEDYANCLKLFADSGVTVHHLTDEELALWHEANKKVVPVALARLKELGVTDGEAFLERAYAVLKEHNF